MNGDQLTWGIILLTVVLIIPFVVYLSAKLWAFGSLRGRQLFWESWIKGKKEEREDKDETVIKDTLSKS